MGRAEALTAYAEAQQRMVAAPSGSQSETDARIDVARAAAALQTFYRGLDPALCRPTSDDLRIFEESGHGMNPWPMPS